MGPSYGLSGLGGTPAARGQEGGTGRYGVLLGKFAFFERYSRKGEKYVTNFLSFVFKDLAINRKISESFLSRFGFSNVLYSRNEENEEYKGVEQW